MASKKKYTILNACEDIWLHFEEHECWVSYTPTTGEILIQDSEQGCHEGWGYSIDEYEDITAALIEEIDDAFQLDNNQ